MSSLTGPKPFLFIGHFQQQNSPLKLAHLRKEYNNERLIKYAGMKDKLPLFSPSTGRVTILGLTSLWNLFLGNLPLLALSAPSWSLLEQLYTPLPPCKCRLQMRWPETKSPSAGRLLSGQPRIRSTNQSMSCTNTGLDSRYDEYYFKSPLLPCPSVIMRTEKL